MSRRFVRLSQLPIVAIVLLLVQAMLPMGHHAWCHGDGHDHQAVGTDGSPVSSATDHDEVDCPVCQMLATTELYSMPAPSAMAGALELSWHDLPAPCPAGSTRAPPDTDGRSSRGPPAGS